MKYKEWRFWIKEVNGDGSWIAGLLVYLYSRISRPYLKRFKGIEITATTTSTADFKRKRGYQG